MRCTDEDIALERRDYYRKNNIGWTARPAHGDNDYNRAGRFKKASNMNFALTLSLRVEDIMQEIKDNTPDLDLDSQDVDDEIYAQALQQAVEESEGLAWAAGDIRV